MTNVTMLLSEQVRPRERYLRAANLEVHQEQSEQYIPTSRALEVLRRFTQSMSDSTAGRSWSLTGPYGAGKSSFALYLRTLLGPVGSRRSAAERTLADADSQLADALRLVLDEVGGPKGFVLATTTCQREPVADSLLRALVIGAEAYWGNRKPAAISAALRSAHESKSARSIAAAASAIGAKAPLLLILDEFGKTLEHFAELAVGSIDGTADLFVLQELAEQATGKHAVPIFTFTLQHLAFDDYVRQASAQQRREWGKVQGRFEDVSFLESAEQSLRLVAGALDDSGMTRAFAKRRKAWAEASFSGARDVGIANHLPGGVETVEHCYPLHPVALLALPELCGQLGQHGRTLFSFLASSEAGTARTFLERQELPRGSQPLPALGLTHLFDFFAGAGQAMALSIGGGRWREIHERIREAGNLEADDIAVLKTVGLLNLMGNALGLRASPDLVAFALSDPSGRTDGKWKDRLEALEGRGFLTFRSFADEYRLWQGSDVDLRGRVADAREQLRSTNAAELLMRLHSDNPVIAARHSQRVGMLRYFEVVYTDDGSRSIPALAAKSPADGTVAYHLGSADSAGQLTVGTDPRPTILVTSEGASRVRDAAIEVAAALAVLDEPEVLEDRVARRELQDRVADARSRLSQALADAFRPGAVGVSFRIVSPDGQSAPIDAPRGLSRLLSGVCDQAYAQSPEIPNEMLGRRDLTSQGAKARRELIEAMIEHPNEEQLGIRGYGPERAMYEAVLRHTGLHAQRDGTWSFKHPKEAGKLQPAWDAIADVIDRADKEPVSVDALQQRLMAPPIGLKEGPIPVLLVAHLLQRPDDVAIYEDGTFQPSLTADLVERLVKAPRKFSLKSFGSTGDRARILAAISRATANLGVGGLRSMSQAGLRNQTVLAVAAPLLNLVRGMPLFTRRTSNLTDQALAVRQALLQAREPDQMLLVDLPAACGFTGAAWRKPSANVIAGFEEALRRALVELQSAYGSQLSDIRDALAHTLKLPRDVTDLRSRLRARALDLEEKVIDKDLRAFIFNATDSDPDDDSWLALIGLTVTGKSVELWLDDDRLRFTSRLDELAAAFVRVEALYRDVQASNLEGSFTARRLTYTTPEGEDTSRIFYYDSNMARRLSELVDRVLNEAEQRVGPDGRDGLVALVVERALQISTPQGIAVANREESTTTPAKARRAHRGN